jgi:hypothetical protein
MAPPLLHHRRLARNQTAYDEKLAWKWLPFSHQSPAFQRHIADTHLASRQSQQCRLCNLLMEARIKPGSIKRLSHCLRDEMWMDGSKSSLAGAAQGLQQAQHLWEEATSAPQQTQQAQQAQQTQVQK